MTAKEFLRKKGILKEGFHHWVVTFQDGKEVDIVDLLEEFKDGNNLKAVISGGDLLFLLEHEEKKPRKTLKERIAEEMEKDRTIPSTTKEQRQRHS